MATPLWTFSHAVQKLTRGRPRDSSDRNSKRATCRFAISSVAFRGKLNTARAMRGSPNMLRAAILTVSDRSSQGLRNDASGPKLVEMLQSIGMDVAWSAVVPDEKDAISQMLISWADEGGADLILTTGGTGLSPRDVTPEATMAVVQRLVPGMAEAMRLASLRKTPHAMISRAVAGVRGRTLIINLPGSPKGALENLDAVLPALEHAIAKIQGDPSECA